MRDSKDRVIIDGTCSSACTLVLGIVQSGRICVTKHAILGFQAAWRPGLSRSARHQRAGDADLDYSLSDADPAMDGPQRRPRRPDDLSVQRKSMAIYRGCQ
jgi:hypothetical protein